MNDDPTSHDRAPEDAAAAPEAPPTPPTYGAPSGLMPADQPTAPVPAWGAPGGWPTAPPTSSQPAPAAPPSWGAPPPPPPPSSGGPSGAGRGRMRHTIMSAVVGALVGALVSSGVFLAVHDDTKTKTVTKRVVPARNTSTLTRPVDTQEVLSIIEPAVVAIQVGQTASGILGGGTEEVGAGSGFVISADGYVVTNNHVVEDADSITVTFTDGETKKAELVGRSAANDLAVVKVNGQDLPFAELGNSEKLQVGDDVIAIGNALALEGGLSVTRGIVSALHRQIDEDNTTTLTNLIQTDAAINRGNSGGPLVNSQGEVVGINTAIADPSVAQNIGFAISISQAKPIVEDLRAGKKVKTAFLGVETQNLTAAIAKELNVDTQKGAVIRRVTAGSPADDAGLKVDDVITKVDDKEVKSAADVQAAVRAKRAGDKVTIHVLRDGNETTVEATLGERSADA